MCHDLRPRQATCCTSRPWQATCRAPSQRQDGMPARQVICACSCHWLGVWQVVCHHLRSRHVAFVAIYHGRDVIFIISDTGAMFAISLYIYIYRETRPQTITVASFPSISLLDPLFLDTVSGESWGHTSITLCMLRFDTFNYCHRKKKDDHTRTEKTPLITQTSPDLMFDVRECCLSTLQSLVWQAIVVAYCSVAWPVPSWLHLLKLSSIC